MFPHQLGHVSLADILFDIANTGPLKTNSSSPVKSIPPNTENSMQYGYDENDNNNMSDETKCETNYSMNNKWNDVNLHNYMQLTKYNKYTNDDVYTDACVVHIIR